jgi:hypothetical protein
MTKRTIKISHIGLALIPIGITPGLVYVLAEGWIDFGGGEKDILLAFPYLLWALFFFVASVVLIIKRWPIRRWTMRAAITSGVVMLFSAIITYAVIS